MAAGGGSVCEDGGADAASPAAAATTIEGGDHAILGYPRGEYGWVDELVENEYYECAWRADVACSNL